MRVVCVRHSKRLEVPARQRLDDEVIEAECKIGDFHTNRDLLTEPSILMYSNDKDPEYLRKLEAFEMFWQQAI